MANNVHYNRFTNLTINSQTNPHDTRKAVVSVRALCGDASFNLSC